uniref:aspartate/glutamate racemase family protein n=1 Tax=Hymenobacter terrenus TaxID=1629124 RepID=UPI000619974F
MSWESSAEYYRLINQATRQMLGGQHSAKILLYSVNFYKIEQLQHAGYWEEAGQEMARCAQQLAAGGADFILLCTNTMHKVAPAITEATALPFVHIADATAAKIQQMGFRKVGLLGTKFTMEQDFYKGRLKAGYGLDIVIPSEAERVIVHDVIYQELCQGRVGADSKQSYLAIIDNLIAQGAEAIILGCTEIMLLIKPEDMRVPIFDTTRIHAEEAVELALGEVLLGK